VSASPVYVSLRVADIASRKEAAQSIAQITLERSQRGMTVEADEASEAVLMLKPVSVADVTTNPSPQAEFAWDGYLPKGVVTLFGAHGGTGKSTVALMLAVSVALGRPQFGVPTAQSKTLFVSLEDGEAIVRRRLSFICSLWGIDPAQLEGQLLIVDGTANPELFTADSRGTGGATQTYFELRKLVQEEGVGLVIVDNASDAYGGDEIQRRQVRAFIRSLGDIAKLSNCALLLLAHVDKATSRARKSEGGEGYSGSTAWHNSVRSRLFMTRTESGTLVIEHQKSNLGRCHEPVTLEWLEDGLPQVLSEQGSADPLNPFMRRLNGREDDERAIALLRMIAEFESRGQYCSPGITSRDHVHAVMKSEPEFLKLKLRQDDTKRIVNQCQRARWIEVTDYRSADRKIKKRWSLTGEGKLIAGLTAPTAPTAPTYQNRELGVVGEESYPQVVHRAEVPFAPTAPTAPTTEDGASWNMAQVSAPTAPTYVGGMGEERTHLLSIEDGAQFSAIEPTGLYRAGEPPHFDEDVKSYPQAGQFSNPTGKPPADHIQPQDSKADELGQGMYLDAIRNDPEVNF